jgi:hypothetical protein
MCYFVFCVLCIVVPLPPGTHPLAVNINNNNNNNTNTTLPQTPFRVKIAIPELSTCNEGMSKLSKNPGATYKF